MQSLVLIQCFVLEIEHFEICEVPDERVILNCPKNGYFYVIFKFLDVIII